MAKGKRDKPTRKERRAQKKQIHFGDEGQDLETQLRSLGLSTKQISGDGNCLFRSLSDQYFGIDKHHRSIRQEICHYLMEHKDTYQYFVEDDRSFQHHISNMEQDGCFGGNMELAAFAKLKKIDIKVYQPGMIYIISGVDTDENYDDAEDENTDETKRTLHIAYHSWEHYSSIRNIDGPFTGLPEIKEQSIKNDSSDSVYNIRDDDDDDDDEKSPDSKEKVILNACPGTEIRKIRRLLRKYKGNTDKVIDAIYESYNKNDKNVELLEDGVKEIELESELEKQNKPNKKEGNLNNNYDDNDNANKDLKVSLNNIKKEDDTTENNKDSLNTKIDEYTTDSTKNNKLKLNNNTKQQQQQKEEEEGEHDEEKQKRKQKPPKKLSARDKKYQKKQQQKEQQMEKKQQKAKTLRSSKNKDTDTLDTNKNTVEENLAMKQLYI